MSDERFERVEERIAWLERHVVAQDKAMLELAEENRRLRRELTAVRERLTASSAPGEEPERPADERPPHY